jgi:hypothetical protein
MIMYKRLLTIAGLLVLSVAWCGVQARSQTGPSGEQMGQGHRSRADVELQRLDRKLKLTDDQKGQIKPILEDREQKLQGLRSDRSLSGQDRSSKRMSIFEDNNRKIREVLNDDQKTKFGKMPQYGRAQVQGHRPGGGTTTGTPQ